MPAALHHWRALTAAISGFACLALACSACGSSTSSHTATAKASGLAAQVPAAVRSRGVLRVATNATYAPNEFLAANGRIVGMDADLATAIARQLGLRAQFFKSTLLRCINHLEKIDSGRIYVNGHLVGYRQDGGRLHELRPREIAAQRREIGMVFQHFNLFPHMSALGNVAEGPTLVRKEPKDLAAERAHKLLHRVGLGDKTDCYPAQLSGGQRQRVAIARALAMQPKLILFDEPTSALDPELVGEVLAVIRDLAADGMTMIIVIHEMSFAREVGDTLVFIDQGVVVEQGAPRQMLADPKHPRTRDFLAKVC